MKYEIRRDRKIQKDSITQTIMTFDEPHWIIYYEGRENIGPSSKGFSTVQKALEGFIDGIGTSEGIVRIVIETQV